MNHPSLKPIALAAAFTAALAFAGAASAQEAGKTGRFRITFAKPAP